MIEPRLAQPRRSREIACAVRRGAFERDRVETGIVFDIQRFAVHDGPGIRTLVFLKGCPLSCQWCENPESQSPEPQLLFYPIRCIGCGSCVAVCPNGALQMEGDAVRYRRELCKNCLRCTNVCPSRALTRCGERRTVKEVLEVALRDKPFYDQTGGGVTLSGGEPVLQAKFACALLEACKANEVSTAIETCGQWDWNVFSPLVPSLDLVLFDIKHIDDDEHRRGTAVGNERILRNLASLCNAGVTVIVRMPIVPDYNDGHETITRTAAWLSSLKTVRFVHLLPYHELGASKYRLLGRPAPLPGISRPDNARIEEIRAVFESKGFTTVIEG